MRPAGSALVELDEPTSKIQRGPAVLSEPSLLGVTASPLSHQYLSQATLISQSGSSPNAIPFGSNTQLHGAGQSISSSGESHSQEISASSVDESSKTDEESVVVDNPNFRSSIFRDNGASIRGALFRSSQQSNENQVASSRGQESQYQEYLRDEFKQSVQIEEQSRQQYEQQQQQSNSGSSGSNVITRSNAAPSHTIALFPSREASSSVFPSTRTSSEQSRSNQQTFIDLLTARGGITEVIMTVELCPINGTSGL